MVGELELFKRVVLKDKNGKKLYDSGLTPSNSYVIAFLEHIYGGFSSVNVTIEDTSDTSRGVMGPTVATSANRNRLNVDGPVSNASYGIVVGTGTTSESNTDHALATQIAHGTGSGQLQHGSTSFVVPTVAASNVDLIVSRTFTNSSGADITVNEIGIYCSSRDSSNSTDYYFCIVRDVLSTPIVVSNGQTLTIQYTLRTTV